MRHRTLNITDKIVESHIASTVVSSCIDDFCEGLKCLCLEPLGHLFINNQHDTATYVKCEVKQECIHSELVSDGGLVLTTDLVHILESWVQGPCREQATCKNNIKAHMC